jgi:hypothetical protein
LRIEFPASMGKLIELRGRANVYASHLIHEPSPF